MSKRSWTNSKSPFPIPHIPPWTPGRVYSFHWATGVNTSQPFNNQTFFVTPFYVPNPTGVTITSIGAELTATGTSAGSLFRCGVYEYTSTGFGRLLIDSGSFSTVVPLGFIGATGTNYFLPQGWYFGVLCGTDGTVRFNGSNVAPLTVGNLSPLDLAERTPILRLTLSTSEMSFYISNGLPQRMPPLLYWTVSIGINARILLGI